MKTKPAVGSSRKSFWLRWPVLVTAIPLSLLFLCLIAAAVHEQLAASRVEAELARIRAAGQPIDDASMNRWFLENTSSEGTVAWGELLRLVAAPIGQDNFEQLAYIGTAAVPERIEPGAAWAGEAAAAQYLQWMRPVIDQIDQASAYPTPVWQPMQFQGFATMLEELQNSRSLIRLLSLEVEHALYHADSQRALRGLESMTAVAAAFDWEICFVADLVQIALRQVHQSMIRRSLATDLWTEDQVQQLMQQVAAAREFSQRWQRVIAGERGMFMGSIVEPRFLTGDGGSSSVLPLPLKLPSSQEALLQAYRTMQQAGEGGIGGLVQRMQNVEEEVWFGVKQRELTPLSLVSPLLANFLPAITSFAVAIQREEDSRRFTLTALAIKAFELREGRWPEQLTQLQQLGLSARDWSTISGGPFGYQVAGEEALLWSYLASKEPRVRATPPKPDGDERLADDIVVRIR